MVSVVLPGLLVYAVLLPGFLDVASHLSGYSSAGGGDFEGEAGVIDEEQAIVRQRTSSPGTVGHRSSV